MSLEFLRQYGGRRMADYPQQPPLDVPPPGDADGDDAEGPEVDHDFEMDAQHWRPVDVTTAPLDPDVLPRRFVDGSNVHETIAWLRDPAGYPVPVVLAELGGVCMWADGRHLRREFAVVERAVAMSIDAFPWNDIEGLAADLADQGLRLLPARPPKDPADGDGAAGTRASGDVATGVIAPTFDFERMREQTRVTVLHEMTTLEEVAWGHQRDLPTLVDGRLGRFHLCELQRHDVVGVIKQQRADYLHPQGWRVLYELEPGQRTPAFVVPSKHLPVVSWYLKLGGADGSMPNWGVVRVEIPRDGFARRGDDFSYIDRLSRGLIDLRCRQLSYTRGPVSLEPIVRAEESLKSLFTSIPALAQHVYRVSGL